MALSWGIFLAVTTWFASVPAQAEESVVKRSDCKINVYKNKKWESRNQLPFSVGQSVKVKPIPGRDSQVYVWVGDAYAAVPKSCLGIKEEPPEDAPSGTSGATAAPMPDLKKKSMYLSVSYLSWSERIRLEEAPGIVSLLNSNQVGLGLGGGLRFRAGRRGQIDLGSQVLITSSQVGPSAANLLAGSANYVSKDSGTFGILARPGFFFFPGSESLAVGFSIPLIYRVANWPNPNSTARFLEKAAFRYGAQLDMQLRRDSWSIGTRLGFVQSLLGLAWDLNLSKSL
ncbi:MAG: hypothetical protein JNL01_12940 [Bdellovibrionales bacterium]|nr:hypothetical protein [Bdellovibrionales bacterium]